MKINIEMEPQELGCRCVHVFVLCSAGDTLTSSCESFNALDEDICWTNECKFFSKTVMLEMFILNQVIIYSCQILRIYYNNIDITPIPDGVIGIFYLTFPVALWPWGRLSL
jgi:hypothetical protein